MPRRTVLLVVAGLALVACGKGADPTVTPPPGAAADVPTTLDPGAATAGAAATTTGGSIPAPAGAGPDTTASSPAGGPVAPTSPAGTTAAFAPPDAGTYTIHTTGSAAAGLQSQSIDRTTTRVVEHVNDTDVRQTESADGAASVTVLRFLPDQILLLSLEINGGPGVQYRFASDAGVLFVRVPPVPGDSWQWTLSTSDGKETVTQATTVGPVERIEVAGQSIDAPRLDTTVTLSGDLVGSIQLTSWLDPGRRTTARAHQVSDLTYAGIRLTSDTTSDLVSFAPA